MFEDISKETICEYTRPRVLLTLDWRIVDAEAKEAKRGVIAKGADGR